MTRSAWRRRLLGAGGDTRGVAAIEFAFVAPLLTLLLVGMTEIGLGVRTQLAAQEAVAAGAQYALKGFNQSAIGTAVQSANPGMVINASPSPAEFYGCPAAAGLTRVAPGAICADGHAARHFADVWATVSRPTVFASHFGLPASITAHATARIP